MNLTDLAKWLEAHPGTSLLLHRYKFGHWSAVVETAARGEVFGGATLEAALQNVFQNWETQ